MEVIYKFDFKEGSDDLLDLKLIQNATEMYLALSDIQDQLRTWYKYDERDAIPVEELRDTLLNTIRDHVDMEKLGG